MATEVNPNGRTYEATYLTLLCCPVTIQCLTGFLDLIGEPVFSPEFTDQRAQIVSHDHAPHLECNNFSNKQLFHVHHC